MGGFDLVVVAFEPADRPVVRPGVGDDRRVPRQHPALDRLARRRQQRLPAQVAEWSSRAFRPPQACCWPIAALVIGRVSIVTPIISTEGGLAALASVVLGEALGIPTAILLALIALGVVLASIDRRAEVAPVAGGPSGDDRSRRPRPASFRFRSRPNPRPCRSTPAKMRLRRGGASSSRSGPPWHSRSASSRAPDLAARRCRGSCSSHGSSGCCSSPFRSWLAVGCASRARPCPSCSFRGCSRSSGARPTSWSPRQSGDGGGPRLTVRGDRRRVRVLPVQGAARPDPGRWRLAWSWSASPHSRSFGPDAASGSDAGPARRFQRPQLAERNVEPRPDERERSRLLARAGSTETCEGSRSTVRSRRARAQGAVRPGRRPRCRRAGDRGCPPPTSR